jgi:hypothetical protein
MFGRGLGVRALGAAAGVAVSLGVACGSASDYPFDEDPLLTVSAGGSGAGSQASGGSGNGDAGRGNAGGATGGANGEAGRSAGGVGSTGAGGLATGGAGSGGDSSAGGSGSGTAGGEAGTGTEGGAGGEGPTVDCTLRGEDARGFDGHCYVFEATKLTFAEAVAACQDREAHLVTISSEGRSLSQFLAENTFVWQLADATPVWIAATDGKGPHQDGDGTFSTWLTDEEMLFDNWSSGQPNNASSACQENDPCSCNDGACYEHCGFLWATAGNQLDAVPGWNDRLCEHRIGYVCEWDGG